MLSMDDLHSRLEAELDRLEELVVEVRHDGVEAAKAEGAYKSEYSKARLTIKATSLSKLTVGELEAEADEQTEELRLRYLITQNALTTTREALRAETTKVDALRSLLASYRSASG